MREVFSSYHLKRNARKNLAICLGAIGFASALLVTGAVSGVLVGPSGLFVFEVKHVRHEVACLIVDLWEARESTLYSAIGSLPVHARAATPWCDAYRDSVAPLRSAEQTARGVQ